MRKTLNRLGIPATKCGQRYIEYAVELIRGDRSLLLSITKELYPRIAERFGVTSNSVERSIRCCVRRSWDTGDRALLARIAGYPLKFRPYPSEFIAMLVDFDDEAEEAKR